jgi:hypothetical protein
MLRFLVWLIHPLPLLDYEHPIPFTYLQEISNDRVTPKEIKDRKDKYFSFLP